ncbi:MAG: ROK family protein [Ferruginibacter sp.]|nr:ROK family protein [Cytophagales bacterium]
MEEYFLGIDVGGTNVKVGLVKADGALVSRQKFSTGELRAGGQFVEKFTRMIGSLLQQNPAVKKVGIGIPGTLSHKRRTTIDLPNLTELNGVKLHKILTQTFDGVDFFLENDAKAAALGEYHFSGQLLPDDLLFITLGTGVGGAAIIKGKLLMGGRGNGMEIGHIMTGNGRLLEDNIGKKGIVEMATAMLATYPGHSVLSNAPALNAEDVEDAARRNDPLATQVFARVGTILGEGLVSTIRLLDINTIVVGGGVSKVFEHVRPSLIEVLHRFLPPYYTDSLDIRLAVLGNNAGMVGAASLCLEGSR